MLSAQVKAKLTEVTRQNQDLRRKSEQQERQLADVNKKMLEYDQKFVDLMAEVARVTTSAKRSDGASTSFLAPVTDENGNPRSSAGDAAETENEADEQEAKTRVKRTQSVTSETRHVTRKRKARDVTGTAPSTRSAKKQKAK